MFQHIIFDLDSTLCSIEGVDELARMNGCLAEVKALTTLAMNGQIPFAEALIQRLNAIQPSRRNIETLAGLYEENLTAGAVELFEQLRAEGSHIHIVTGGYRQALGHIQHKLNISDDHVHAIDLNFNEAGEYVDFDRQNLLCQPQGKTKIIEEIQTRYPQQRMVMIGDGVSDAETMTTVDRYICFAGHVQRPVAMNSTSWVVTTPDLREVLKLLSF